MRNKERVKILAVLLSVMLILACIPVGIAFAAPGTTPTVTGISPASGSTAGGTPVVITGTLFAVSSTVYFGSTVAAAVYDSPTQITATSPAAAVAGAVDVTVYNGIIESSTSPADQFTYVTPPTVTGISPASGYTAGGASVVITGTLFAVSSTVYFGSTVAAAVYDNPTQITATSPAAAVAGAVDVTVYNGIIESSTSPADLFIYMTPGGGGGGGGGSSVSYAPAVQTDAATSVTTTSAVLNGDITSDNGYDVTAYGFLWGTSSTSLTNTLAVGTNNESGAFSDTLSGLTDGTTYYFEAYATNSEGTADGTILSITAGVQTPTPAVQTEAATSVTTTSAVLNGDITSDNGYDVTAYGFLWGTSSTSLTNTLAVGTNNESGAFSDTLSGLTDGTTYYFEAYATNSYGTADGSVLSLTAGVQTPTTSTGTVFSDVPPSFWGYSIITSMSNQGIVAGYPDGTFKPNADITRAEFAVMLVKALGLSITGTTSAFTDVAQGSWLYGSVNAAAAAGLVSGLGNNQFGPYTLITRQEMAVMVAKALGTKAPATDGTELNAFSDGSHVSSWATTGMDEAVKAGIVIGMSADHLAPQAHATRAQAAAMIYQLLNFLGK